MAGISLLFSAIGTERSVVRSRWVSFVDETLYRGTCYRACGFEQVGASAGFSRSARDYYTAHGVPKALYLRELEPGARKVLCRPQLPAALREAEADIAGPCPLKAEVSESLCLGSVWFGLFSSAS